MAACFPERTLCKKMNYTLTEIYGQEFYRRPGSGPYYTWKEVHTVPPVPSNANQEINENDECRDLVRFHELCNCGWASIIHTTLKVTHAVLMRREFVSIFSETIHARGCLHFWRLTGPAKLYHIHQKSGQHSLAMQIYSKKMSSA